MFLVYFYSQFHDKSKLEGATLAREGELDFIFVLKKPIDTPTFSAQWVATSPLSPPPVSAPE